MGFKLTERFLAANDRSQVVASELRRQARGVRASELALRSWSKSCHNQDQNQGPARCQHIHKQPINRKSVQYSTHPQSDVRHPHIRATISPRNVSDRRYILTQTHTAYLAVHNAAWGMWFEQCVKFKSIAVQPHRDAFVRANNGQDALKNGISMFVSRKYLKTKIITKHKSPKNFHPVGVLSTRAYMCQCVRVASFFRDKHSGMCKFGQKRCNKIQRVG